MLRVSQWGCLGIDRVLFLAYVGVAQDPEPLSVGGHDAILDTVVDHLDKMAGAVGTAVQVSLLGGAIQLLAARRAWDVTRTRRQHREDGIKALDDVLFSSNHHAVTSF